MNIFCYSAHVVALRRIPAFKALKLEVLFCLDLQGPPAQFPHFLFKILPVKFNLKHQPAKFWPVGIAVH